MIEKRIIERLELSLPVKLTVDGTVFEDLCTKDISSNGVFIAAHKNFMSDTKVELVVFIPVTNPHGVLRRSRLNAIGKIVRIGKQGMAIQFDSSCKINSSSITTQ